MQNNEVACLSNTGQTHFINFLGFSDHRSDFINFELQIMSDRHWAIRHLVVSIFKIVHIANLVLSNFLPSDLK